MSSRRATDDSPGGSAPCRPLTNGGVARRENTKTQSDADVTTTIPLLMMQIRSRIKLRGPPDVAGTFLRKPLCGRIRARGIQILSLHVCPRLARHAQPLSSHTVDMADMGSLQLPKDHAGYGSRADNALRLPPGIFFQHLV
jgi:hypothetical protein